MKYTNYLILICILLLASCAKKAPEPIQVEIPTRPINYLHEVKPVLDKRCAVCHSCYNSPCQLKLSSYEGVDRGGRKEAEYNASRLATMDPTRLFIDAQTTEEWRKKDFHTVTESSAGDGLNNSLMLQILNHKMVNPVSRGEYYSEANDLTCSETSIELDGYLSKHPNRGMPFGFPPLTKEEFELIAGWLAQGAKGPSPAEQEKLTTPLPADSAEIVKWETFLNKSDAKHAMTARYLYDHLFLAHIKFGTETNEFYELLRSTTPPGERIDLIDSVRPYDDPEVDTFYYRFRKIHSTIVHKTHMVFNFDDAQMRRFQELFIQPKWLQPPHRMGYEKTESANPFAVFEQIPPRSRYQFLLDNAHYIIMTFIRGPVCRGQVALNVINDHFWVMFMDPEFDLTVKYPAFLKQQKDNLIMPIEMGSKFPISGLIGSKYDKAVDQYYKARQNYYMALNYDGLHYDAIWKGNKAEDTPLLTVYRHFNSASVHKGVLGNLPRTLWVIDYPLLERIYYALVAGFDVYGTLGHQLAVRLYMDSLREEGESSFLAFMPEEKRREMVEGWYKGVSADKLSFDDAGIPNRIDYTTGDHKREFVEYIVNNHINPLTNISFDPINYVPDNQYPDLPKQYKTVEDYMQGFRAVSKPGTEFISFVTDYSANVAYVRIRKNDGSDTVISMVVNRWHDNVTYMFSEKNSLNPSKDSVDFLEGFHGSYPNYFLDIREDDLPDFFEMFSHLEDRDLEKVQKRFDKYGINRSRKDFWQQYDWFQERFAKDQPVQSGLFDLNRYYYFASE